MSTKRIADATNYSDVAGERRTSGVDIAHGRIYHNTGAPLSFTDPAELLDFGRPIAAPDAARFDNRSDKALEEAAFTAPTPLLRERALWELVDRNGEDSHDVVERFLLNETDRACRTNALWLLQKSAGTATPYLLSTFFYDDDPEVADWARLLAQEITGEPIEMVHRRAVVREEGAFDQTLPLIIAGYTLVNVPQYGRIKVSLSPLWFESILGRVMACTNHSTFTTDLVIEKALDGLHPDGSTHYETFLFKGVTYKLTPGLFEHHYESVTTRAFYPSGTVEVGDSIPVAIPLARVAGTEVEMPPAEPPKPPPPPSGGTASTGWIIGDGPRAKRIARDGYVRSVRGRYYGWAAINLNTVLQVYDVPPGAIQLSNPTHPVAGPMTNGVLYGTFRGKVSDHTGDGSLDINSIPCHSTVAGEHDLYCDGSKVDDPFLR